MTRRLARAICWLRGHAYGAPVIYTHRWSHRRGAFLPLPVYRIETAITCTRCGKVWTPRR